MKTPLRSSYSIQPILYAALLLGVSLFGCVHPADESVSRTSSAVPMLAVGRLLGCEIPKSLSGKAAYEIEKLLAGPACCSKRSGCIIFEFYVATCEGILPTNALLVLVQGDKADCLYLQRTYDDLIPVSSRPVQYLNLQLLGGDVSRSLIPDTMKNRERLLKAVFAGDLYPRHDQMLSKNRAIKLALTALDYDLPPDARKQIKATRYVFGWVIEWLPVSYHGIGAPATVVVRDDGAVVYALDALY